MLADVASHNLRVETLCYSPLDLLLDLESKFLGFQFLAGFCDEHHNDVFVSGFTDEQLELCFPFWVLQ